MPRKKKEEEIEIEENKTHQKEFISAVGRRKDAVARVRLYTSFSNSNGSVSRKQDKVNKGDIFVNNRKIEEYFRSKFQNLRYIEPFQATNTLGKYAATIKVSGGGLAGQLDAIVLGISRALAKLNKDKFRPILKKKGFLTQDSRIRERRKVGTGGKARRKKQSPKR